MGTFLIVGLGNPGPEYASTRHNIGWVALDELVREVGSPALRKKFQGDVGKGTLAGSECILLRPGTFMNESGRSVQPAAAFFQVPPRDLIVLHDELDLPFGDVRIKVGGGHAGHNGLRSLVQHLGTGDFTRVRFGIGRPPAGFAGEVADFVLSGFSASERPGVDAMVASGVRWVTMILERGVDRAMKEANTRDREGKKSGN